MSEQYKRELLRIACAQICQTIGYNTATTSSLEILQDLLQRFILEFSKNLRQHVELCNRTAPTLSDVCLTLSSLSININELQDYVGNVEPVAFILDVPKFPASKTINLNFLKPGSKEVLSRPVHVFEHLPPMLPCEENYTSSATKVECSKSSFQNQELPGYRNGKDPESDPANSILATLAPTSKMLDERATREISSVVMTTGGFISPAIEGKLPEAGLPTIIDKLLGLDALPPPTPPPLPTKTDFGVKRQTAELDEKTAKVNVDLKDPKKNVNIQAIQPQSSIKKSFKPYLKDDAHMLKHLKKSKKKNTSLVVTNMSSLSLEEILNMNIEKLSEKGRRKRLKLLQKFLKNTQNNAEFEDIKGHPFSTYVTSLPPGLERLTLEKLLKKQAKQRQKLLKKRKQTPHNTNQHIKVQNQRPDAEIKNLSELTKNPQGIDLQKLQSNNSGKQSQINSEQPQTGPPTDSQHTTVLATNNSTKALDLKLSNEPDRSKLNIFKKISKAQKGAGQTSPVLPTLHVGVFTGSGGEIINLPTGTTITPAPHITDVSPRQESDGVLRAPPPVTGNIPKKRGRKPGSKNQPKPQNLPSGNLAATNSNTICKKPKKIKLSKAADNLGNINPLSVDGQLSVAALNRSQPTMLPPFAVPSPLKPIQRKERKEKTERAKSIPEVFENSQKLSKSVLSNPNVKTEPFAMGSVQIKPLDLLLNDPNKEHLPSLKSKKRQTYNIENPKKKLQSPPNLMSSFALAQNMLPMFPFSFPPRPGLIPAPGLFTPGATGLTGFPNQPTALPIGVSSNISNPSLMGLAAQLFPYATSNPFPTPSVKERKCDPLLTTSEQRNYCNVAPLIPPESIPLVGGNTSLKSSGHTNMTNLSEKPVIDEILSAKLAQTGNLGDPIEVSDDSDEITAPLGLKAIDEKSSDSMPKKKSLHSSAPFLSAPSSSFKEKKHKKLQKTGSFPKGNAELDVFPLSAECAQTKNFDVAFEKLAGGADLIPLSGTVPGSAYSAKSIPTTSLTASARQINPASLLGHPILEGTKTANAASALFSGVTITPTITNAHSEVVNKKKSKEHKKLRKLKEGIEGKIKKKKDKKDKLKEKERINLLLSEGGQEKVTDSNKESLKKLKKEKKKEKQRLKEITKAHPDESREIGSQLKPTEEALNSLITPLNDIATTSSQTSQNVSVGSPSLPKLTLKIGSGCQSPGLVRKLSDDEQSKFNSRSFSEREPSPELARFSPLVTRPPKQKLLLQSDSADVPSESNNSLQQQEQQQSLLPPPSPWLSGSTLTASSVLLPQQLMSSTTLPTSSPKLKLKPEPTQKVLSSKIGPETNATVVGSTNPVSLSDTVPLIKETNRPSSYVDAEGNTVWICPACGKVDDGSPMIGCDGCDAWYHWDCVGIAVAPKDNEDWFCRVCITRKKGFLGCNDGQDKKRKKNKKKL